MRPSRARISRRSREDSISSGPRDEIRSGRATFARKIAVCSGSGHLSPEDRAELLAVLSLDSDERVSGRAKSSLLTVPVEYFIAALNRHDAAPELFFHCAQHLVAQPGVADALAYHPKCPSRALARAALHLSAKGVKAACQDLDRLSADTPLVAALRTCPNAELEQQRLLDEMLGGVPDPKELAESLLTVEPDPGKRQTLLQRLSKMRVVERVQLALKGNREERIALIRDANKVVQRAVLSSPRLTEQEVEVFAAMSTISEDALRIIAHLRAYAKNYIIARSLLNNPKTPVDVTLHLLPRLKLLDLKMLSINKNITNTLRTSALRLYRQRVEEGIGR